MNYCSSLQVIEDSITNEKKNVFLIKMKPFRAVPDTSFKTLV